MGNLMAESGLNTTNVENSFESRVGNDQSYTARVNSGEIDEYEFTYPFGKGNGSFGYGLAQWTYWSRRQNLYRYIKTNVTPFDISSLDGQLNFIIEELTTNSEYASVWAALTNATSVTTACDAVMSKYEGPSNPHRDTRQEYAAQYFAKYSNSSGTYSASTSVPAADALLSVAASQLGQGHGTFTDWWYGKSGTGYDHWCMMFVQWCMEKCGISSPYKTAQCQAFYDNTNGLHVDPNGMQRGDIILFHWGGQERYWNHTGFVESVSGDSFTTIEGNTGGGNGIVKRNTYKKSSFKPFNSGAYQDVAFVRLTGVGTYFGSGADAYTSQAANTVGRTLEEIQAGWADFHYEEKAVELNYELQREQVTEDITCY